jgi:hypothetical protein
MKTFPSSGVLWLLKRLGSGPKNRALAGDIIEEGSQRRSNFWCWQQTLHASVVGSFEEIRSHKLVATLAVLTGWTSLIACYSLFYATRDFMPPFLRLSSGISPVVALTMGWVCSKTLTIFSFAMSGWLVAKLNRRSQLAMVIVFSFSVFLVDILIVGVLAFAAISIRSAFVMNSLAIFSLTAFCEWLALLVGGLMYEPPEADPLPTIGLDARSQGLILTPRSR